jgi:excisionase family DNA binding protein
MPSTRAPNKQTSWLGLGAASHVLGIDPDTLRRWADSGRVEVFHTPGGHRRFSRHALDELVRTGTRDRATLTGLGATPRRLASAYRRTYRLTSRAEPDHRTVVAPADRAAFRQTGRRLVDALVRHVDAEDPVIKHQALGEAARSAQGLGRRLKASGVSLTDAVALFVAARRPFLAELTTLGHRRALDSPQLARLFGEASAALDHCLLEFIDGHRSAP